MVWVMLLFDLLTQVQTLFKRNINSPLRERVLAASGQQWTSELIGVRKSLVSLLSTSTYPQPREYLCASFDPPIQNVLHAEVVLARFRTTIAFAVKCST